MDSSNPSYSPLASGTKLEKNITLPEENDPAFVNNYQSVVGSLMYAMLGTRPDISFAVTKLSQFNSNPTPEHLKAAKHVLRYLASSRNFKLRFGSIDDNEIIGYSDSDYAGDASDRRSTTGYTFFFAGGAIGWASKKQTTVALSSTEAEYMAVSEASRHATWLRTFIRELGFAPDAPTTIYVDNAGSVALAQNPVYHKRTKHIDIRHHYIRECIESNIVQLVQIPTAENIADVLTKNLARDRHALLAGKLGLIAKD
jgi:hypothetical protein